MQDLQNKGHCGSPSGLQWRSRRAMWGGQFSLSECLLCKRMNISISCFYRSLCTCVGEHAWGERDLIRHFCLSVFTPNCGSRCLWRAFTPSAYHSWWHMSVRLRFFAVTLHFSRLHPCFCSLHHSYLSDGILMWDSPIVSSRILCLRPHRPHLKRVMNLGWTSKCWQTRSGW